MGPELIETPERGYQKQLAFEFERLLLNPTRTALQQFFESNCWVLGFASSAVGFAWALELCVVQPQFVLTNDTIVDFVAFTLHYHADLDQPSGRFVTRPKVTFISIGPPDAAFLSDASTLSPEIKRHLRQTEEHKEWVQKNSTGIRTLLEGMIEADSNILNSCATFNRSSGTASIADRLAHGIQDSYLIVVGRRDAMTYLQRFAIGEVIQEMPNVNLQTYDVILDRLLASAAFGWPIEFAL